MNKRQINSVLAVLGVFTLSATAGALAQSKQQRFHYDYDDHGRMTVEQIDDSAIYYKAYTSHGMSTDVSVMDDNGNAQIINQMEIGKDGAPRKVHFGDTANIDYTLHTTDGFSRQLSSHLYRLGSPMLRENNMVYDAAGRLKQYYRYQQNDAADVFKYNYDDMGKLTRFSVGGQWNDYGYDEQGNLNYKSGLSGAGYQIAHLPRQAYNSDNQNVTHVYWRYDDEGNLIEDEQYDNDGNLIRDEQYIYKYNAANRLVMVLDSKTQKWLSHYLYDSSGNRVRKITPDTTTYYFRNDVGNIAFEEVYNTATGELIKKVRYVGANGLNVARVTTSAQGERTVEYQYNNRMKSQSVRWDDKGKLALQEYSPFGEQMKTTAIHQGAYGFTQHEDDTETGSIYMKARHYQADYGRMNRPDPARDFDIYNPSSFNLYAYVGNNPVNAWDPTGLCGDAVAGELGVAFGAAGNTISFSCEVTIDADLDVQLEGAFSITQGLDLYKLAAPFGGNFFMESDLEKHKISSIGAEGEFSPMEIIAGMGAVKYKFDTDIQPGKSGTGTEQLISAFGTGVKKDQDGKMTLTNKIGSENLAIAKTDSKVKAYTTFNAHPGRIAEKAASEARDKIGGMYQHAADQVNAFVQRIMDIPRMWQPPEMH